MYPNCLNLNSSRSIELIFFTLIPTNTIPFQSLKCPLRKTEDLPN